MAKDGRAGKGPVLLNVLLTDGQQRKTLAAARSLGAAGHRVVVAEVTRVALTRFSRFTGKALVCPPPGDASRFGSWIRKAVRDEGIDVAIPMDDATTSLAVATSDAWGAKALVPEPTAYRRLTDKLEVLRVGREAGVKVPSFRPSEEGVRDGEGEVVYKPRHASGGRGIRPVGPGEGRLPDGVLVERIPAGRKFDVGLLYGPMGDLRASFVQEELLWFPSATGPSIVQESLWRPDLVETARAVVERVGWRGPVEVEFMEGIGGVAYLMEVNTRFWASLALAVRAGVDFPGLTAALAAGEDVVGPKTYRLGLRCRWTLPAGALDWAWHPWTHLCLRRCRPPLGSFDDILSWADPGPAFGAAAALVRYLPDARMWRLFIGRRA